LLGEDDAMRTNRAGIEHQFSTAATAWLAVGLGVLSWGVALGIGAGIWALFQAITAHVGL
jgi:hypothetical protein